MKKWAVLVGLCVVLPVLVCAALVFLPDWEYILVMMDGAGRELQVEDRDLLFDAGAVATAGRSVNPLSPLPEGASCITPEPSGQPVLLGESALLAVTSAAVEGEDRLRLVGVRFRVPCADVGRGLQEMWFTYVKPREALDEWQGLGFLFVDVGVNSVGCVRYMAVARDVTAYGARQPGLELPGLAIRVEDAIHIAEEQGGSAFRTRAQNACEVRGWLERETGRWSVQYWPAQGRAPSRVFYVSAKTGAVATRRP